MRRHLLAIIDPFIKLPNSVTMPRKFDLMVISCLVNMTSYYASDFPLGFDQFKERD